MDQETVLRQFAELENKIEHLIDNYKRLESVNAELEQTNQNLSTQLQEKIASERQHDELKNLIRSKIDSLMGRLDDFTED